MPWRKTVRKKILEIFIDRKPFHFSDVEQNEKDRFFNDKGRSRFLFLIVVSLTNVGCFIFIFDDR